MMKTEVTFKKYVTCDTNLMTSELFTIDELIGKRLSVTSLSGDEEERGEVILASFKDKLNCMENF